MLEGGFLLTSPEGLHVGRVKDLPGDPDAPPPRVTLTARGKPTPFQVPAPRPPQGRFAALRRKVGWQR